MIVGERIRLRAPERSDLPDFVRWFNDPEVIANLAMYAPMSLASEEQWFEGLLTQKDHYVFCIEVAVEADWRKVGNCGVDGISWKNRHCSVGISIGEKAYWDQGVGTAALRLLVGWCFDELGLNRVQLTVFARNERAVRCYEKVGFRLEGTKRQALYRDGGFCDVHLMSILQEEWRAGAGNPPA